jgi:hypothetical protein
MAMYLLLVLIWRQKYLVYTDNKKFKLGWFRWANDGTILLSAHYPNERGAFKYGESQLHKVLTSFE